MLSLSSPTALCHWPPRAELTEASCAKSSSDGGQRELTGIDVLVVDDEEDCRDLLRVVLELRGARVRTCGCVMEALGELGLAPADILISDIGMPRLDGYALIRKVREREEGTGHHLPAIALTAYARDKDRKEAYAAGYECYLVKPLRPAELIDLVGKLLAESRPPASGIAPRDSDGPEAPPPTTRDLPAT